MEEYEFEDFQIQITNSVVEMFILVPNNEQDCCSNKT